MTGVGFPLSLLNGHIEPGIWMASATVNGDEFLVPIDLIVPEGAATAGAGAEPALVSMAIGQRGGRSGWRPHWWATAR